MYSYAYFGLVVLFAAWLVVYGEKLQTDALITLMIVVFGGFSVLVYLPKTGVTTESNTARIAKIAFLLLLTVVLNAVMPRPGRYELFLQAFIIVSVLLYLLPHNRR